MTERKKDLFSAGEFAAVELGPADIPRLQRLLERCVDYFELVGGEAPGPQEAAEMLVDRPPGRPVDSGMAIGLISADGALCGVISAARDYPQPGEWWIGLILVDPARRSQGLGAAACRGFEEFAARGGARQVGIGVVQANQKALHFWKRLGYEQVERRPPQRYGQRDHVVLVLKKQLDQEGQIEHGGNTSR
jgi:ribosomal protein S18 acetylase RimI-like enzyme